MNPTFKQVTKTRYVELVAELAQEIFVQHYTKLTPKVAAALADKYQSDILTDDEIHSGVINYFLIYLGTEPVGYFALDLGPAGAMCLSRLFLKEKARGQGIGRSIVAYAQKLAEGDGRSRLYESLGPRPEGRGLCKKVPLPQGRDRPHGGFARHHAGYHHLGKAVAVKRRGVGDAAPLQTAGCRVGAGHARPRTFRQAPNIRKAARQMQNLEIYHEIPTLG